MAVAILSLSHWLEHAHAADTANTYSESLNKQLEIAGEKSGAWKDLILKAPPKLRQSIEFLVENMPDDDLKRLEPDYVLRNVTLAHKARAETLWAKEIPEELFLEQVLPYASINERRDDWRQQFFDKFMPMVRDLKTAQEAVEKLNIEVFKTFNVKYHATKRPKPDQSPLESIEAGFASCTGLSVLLIDACRAVGIPARFVGTPSWTTVRGNHSWVEVFTDQWRFVGACEPSRLDETWFLGNASKADESNPINRIYATSYRKTDQHFPLIWNKDIRWVPAEDVTRWYTKRKLLKVSVQDPTDTKTLQIRLNGRIVAQTSAAQNREFDLAGGKTYEWSIVDQQGKILKSGNLEMPADKSAELKF